MCQTVWIQISTNVLLVLIWVQAVFKGYQQMTKVVASKERVKYNYCIDVINKHLLNNKGATQAQWSKCI